MSKIDFNRPYVAGREFEYIRSAIENRQISGDGPFTRRAAALLEEELPAHRVLLTTSCTHALEMAALLLNLSPGDEVVVPAFTFVTTANAFALHGATPVFADIRPDTLNLDEARLSERITPRTRAIVPVHYGGVACEMDLIEAAAKKAGALVVEDNAHGLFAAYREKPLGTMGALGTLSFHETKNFSCGEGGALIVNDPALVARAEIIREKGTDRSAFFRGEVNKYTWVDFGSSYLLSDALAAFLLAQLEEREDILGRRASIWKRYRTGLSAWAAEQGVDLPVVPAHCTSSHHLFHLLLPTPEARDAFLTHMKARNISAIFHYIPLHTSRMGKTFGGKEGDCPVAESVSARLARLPFYNGLTQEDQDRVIEAVSEFRC